MRAHQVVLNLAWFFFPPSLLGTAYVYFFPVVQNCGFPDAVAAEAACYLGDVPKPAVAAELAPFRLLVFGDPQLEGDTSLPDAHASSFPSLQRFWKDGGDTGLDGVRNVAVELMTQDVPTLLQGYRKMLDLWGNDKYLAHIYRTVDWWTQPTHAVVLGDLLGSQWIGDAEFKKRSRRFWKTVFKGLEKVPREVTERSGRTEKLGEDTRWRKRMIAVAGNHDIGYAGDIDQHRVTRFEDTFGSVNWGITFRLNHSAPEIQDHPPQAFGHLFQPSIPELRLVMLNSMNLDEPARQPELGQQSREFLNTELALRKLNKRQGTILLTHIPLHKEAGVCVDAPYFSCYPTHEGGTIKEQNHLSESTSNTILHGLTAATSSEGASIVLNGHDHEGCDVYHYRNTEDTRTSEADDGAVHEWGAKSYQRGTRFTAATDLEGKLREITVQSMMGSFGGNAGLLSAWFDHEADAWRFDYATCPFGVQHIWWAVHILNIVEVGLWTAGIALLVRSELALVAAEKAEERRKEKKA